MYNVSICNEKRKDACEKTVKVKKLGAVRERTETEIV